MKQEEDIYSIPVDSVFSPIRRVKYKVENTRVGDITDYDRLILAITTDGTILPEMALVEASKILRKHLNPFIQYYELGKEIPGEQQAAESQSEKTDKNSMLLAFPVCRSQRSPSAF